MAHDIDLKNAHDVRHMGTCGACGDLGDGRRMIDVGKLGVQSMYHDICAVSAFTHAEILRLPMEELNKFTLHATGVPLMKAIMKACE